MLQSTLAFNNIKVFTMLFKAFTISRKSVYNTSSVLLAPRKGRINGAVLRTKSYYKPVSFLNRYGTIKIPLYSKAINTQQRIKFCRFHQQWLRLYLSEILLIKWETLKHFLVSDTEVKYQLKQSFFFTWILNLMNSWV